MWIYSIFIQFNTFFLFLIVLFRRQVFLPLVFSSAFTTLNAIWDDKVQKWYPFVGFCFSISFIWENIIEQIHYLCRSFITTGLNAKSDTRLTENLQCLHSLMTALPVTPYYACVWKPTELKPRKIHVPSSELLFAKGVAELGEEKTTYFLCPDGLFALSGPPRKSCIFWYKSELFQRLLWNMTWLMEGESLENRTSTVTSLAHGLACSYCEG